MKKSYAIVFFLLTGVFLLQSVQAQEEAFRKHIYYLASDELGGRFPGTAGDTLAARYIRETLALYGYKPVIDDGLQSFSYALGLKQDSCAIRDTIWTFNVAMMLEGSDPELKEESLVLGAHYDHLGRATFGGSRMPDANAIHYGADDNASGVAMMLEIARQLVGKNPQRTLIVAAFGAEEQGIIGSKYFVNHFPDTLPKPVLMVNLDMVGRLNEKKRLEINGTGTFTGAEDLLNATPNPDSLQITMIKGGFGPSDHTAFYGNNIPVLFFTTGVHYDYHTPEDNAEKINYSGMKKVYDYILNVVEPLINTPFVPEYQKIGNESSAQSPKFKVTFGIIPDFNNVYEGDGMRADFVTAGKPAEIAGMKNGDIILQIGDKQVHNIQDYMERLSELQEGEKVYVTIKRETEILTLTIDL